MKRVAGSWRLVDAASHRIRSLVRNLTSVLGEQYIGRRALQEIQFARYRVVDDRDERDVQELALRRLERRRLRTRHGV